MTDEDLEALKDRPHPLQSFYYTDDERDQISEAYAAAREHTAEMLEQFHLGCSHYDFERRMRRVSVLLADIRKIEDDVRERTRVRRETPLVANLDALGS